jgi:hypothetical protein
LKCHTEADSAIRYYPQWRTSIYPAECRSAYVAQFPSAPFRGDLLPLISALPPGFQALAERGQLSLRTIEILCRCSEATRKGLLITPRDQYDPPLRRYQDFFEACPCIAPDQTAEHPALEKLIMQALIYFCVHTWNTVRINFGFLRGVRDDWTHDLSRSKMDEASERDVMVWIYVNLIMAWGNESDGFTLQPAGKQILRRLQSATWFRNDSNWIQQRLRSFFSNPRFEEHCNRYLRAPTT